MAESGANVIRVDSGTPSIGGTITVASGATLTHTVGTAVYAGAINGTLGVSGGTANLASGVPTSGWTLNGARGSETVRLRQSGTYTGANISAFEFGIADVADSTVDVTFLDSTLNIGALTGTSGGLYLGWGGIASGRVTIGPGTTLTTPKICMGDNGKSTSSSIRSVFTVDGGTVNLTEDLFYIAYNGPHSDFIMNSGTMNVRNAPIRLRANNQAFGGGNTSRFIQNGGTFNYSGSGFLARFEDNTDEGQIVFKGGEFNASANWSIPHFISTCFKDGDANGWTLTQTNGTTATWNTALTGDGNVTLNGTGTLVGNKEMQGAVGGKWTVGDGFTAGLQGAASLLGGLDIGEGASVTVNIATNRSAVFTARDFGDRDLSNENSIVGRFNKKPGGTTRGTITHDETLLFTNYAQAARPFGDMNYSATYAVGHFYVEESKTGTWSFEGRCDDRAALWIDGKDTGLTGDSNNTLSYKVVLAKGWHKFRIQTADFTGSAGPWSGQNKKAVSYQVAGGTETFFSEATLQMTVCPDGYVQGGVTLASNATFSNNATENAAVIYGDVTATGTGATMSGAFKFDGGTLAFLNVAPNARDLTTMLAFENQPADYLADVDTIAIDYMAKPTRNKVKVCPAGGLTAAAAAQKVRVTVDGEPVPHFQCLVENGDLKVRFASGTVLFVR